jgi:phosphoadenosine phosphosulfate reductase
MVDPQPTPPPYFAAVDANDAEAIVRASIEHFGRKIGLSCSFGGAGGMALLDMALKYDPGIDVFLLDTDVLFDDTYKFLKRVEQRYGITVRRVRPEVSLDEQAARHGDKLWERDPNLCCTIRKVEPMKTSMVGLDAWITAIRRDQSSTRQQADVFSWDVKFGLWKICPLVHWTEEQVMRYVGEHNVPINPMLYEGYTSIGCKHCTAKPLPGDEARSGRWMGFMKSECGLHSGPVAATTPVELTIKKQ